jgi:hypothetical protein
MSIRRDSKGRIYSEPGELAEKPIPVRFTRDADAALREMGDRSAYIREAVSEKLKQDGLLE